MKVWNNSWYSKDLIELVSHATQVFVHELTRYFQNKSYGEWVSEIFYIEVCEDPVFTINPAGNILYYSKLEKGIEVGLCLDFEIAIKLTKQEFSRYLANKYMERSLDIDELHISDFDIEGYIRDLETFFKMHGLL